jgi:hypothetical protein
MFDRKAIPQSVGEAPTETPRIPCWPLRCRCRDTFRARSATLARMRIASPLRGLLSPRLLRLLRAPLLGVRCLREGRLRLPLAAPTARTCAAPHDSVRLALPPSSSPACERARAIRQIENYTASTAARAPRIPSCLAGSAPGSFTRTSVALASASSGNCAGAAQALLRQAP